MYGNIINAPPGYCYQLASSLFGILAEFVRYGYFSKDEAHKRVQDNINENIHNMMIYISNHWAEDISLQSIADMMHVSYFHLSRTFKDCAGISFRDYLNSTRLKKACAMLIDSDDFLLNIAVSNGFPSDKTFSAAFIKQYGMTPGKYRKQAHSTSNTIPTSGQYLIGNENNMLYASVDNALDLSYIYSLIAEKENSLTNRSSVWKEDRFVETSVLPSNIPFSVPSSMIGTCGRAADLLRAEIQKQVLFAKKYLGYRYFRFHGIFNDEMMVFNRNTDGTVLYNWIYIDQILDFLIGAQLHPFIELSFTPSEIATSDTTLFWYRANISLPDPDAWKCLVTAFFQHCIERYGRSEVIKWYVEVWNEPDYKGVFFEGTLEDYLNLYDITVQQIKKIDPRIKVGGPSITSICYNTTNWISEFVSHCSKEHIPMDFVSFHVYSERPLDYMQKENSDFPPLLTSINLQKNAESSIIQHYKEQISKIGVSVPEYHITEWNVSSKQRLSIRDTAFMAPYLIHGALENWDQVNSLAYWCVSDLIEELKAPLTPFHGGLGLLNFQGIPKPSFWGLNFLSRLGNQLIKKGNGYIITRQQMQIQILVYNLAYLDHLAIKNISFVNKYTENIYSLFEEKPTLAFHFRLSGLTGMYRMTRYEINRNHGSAYDIWMDSGASNHPSKEEVEYFRNMARPRVTRKILQCDQEYISFDCLVPAHGCALITLSPIFEYTNSSNRYDVTP